MARRVLSDQIVAEKEAFELRLALEGVKNVIRTPTSNPVVLQTDCLQVVLVPKDGCKVLHCVIVEVIIVQEDLLKRRVGG